GLTHRLDWADTDRHVTDYQAELLRQLPVADGALGWRPGPLPGWDGPLPGAVREELRRRGLPPRDFVLVHPGTGAAVKEWPLPRWRAVAEQLAADGLPLVCTGNSAREARAGGTILAGLGRCANLCGRLTWREFVAAVRYARLLVGVDSVAGHVAAAVGTP